MNRYLAPALICLALAGCGGAANTPALVVTDACKVVATLKTAAEGAVLDAQDPHSAAGVLWADLQSACVNGAPSPAVKTDWVGIVLAGLKTAAPYIIPVIAAAL